MVFDLYVCDFHRKFASPVHQDSQICDKNHIFVTSLVSFLFVTSLKPLLEVAGKLAISPHRNKGDFFD